MKGKANTDTEDSDEASVLESFHCHKQTVLCKTLRRSSGKKNVDLVVPCLLGWHRYVNTVCRHSEKSKSTGPFQLDQTFPH